MTYVVIRRLLELRFNSLSPTLDTAFENVPYTPKQGTPWQRLNMLPSETDNPTFGDTFMRESGIFQVTLFYPVNAGSSAAQTRAELIRSWFARGLTMTESGIRVLVDKSPSVGPAAVVEGWHILPVSIPYIADVP